ncbi:T-complex protein 1, theta subunit [Pneumocystis jirovecii RU7]|uniref:CCT-theta n=1 Tax=Pneumocystis jirovecii (strain RU7) TaxID=1408657 RepID=A0A0W4ZRD2_PNEJ7|nr:T-complex protein 1, theta subunit [Pneumocystis jirovecii RU7]KTW30941.1 T-complex protein 1, theta subunit [Pneumocystis jirovecii RU7]
MSLKMPKAPGPMLFKEGYRVQQGVDNAVVRNIHAISELSDILRTSYGPNGRNKVIVNHLQKMMVTSDAAIILQELDVVHPAAKIIVMASKQQDTEMGDATNFVLILAGELLKNAEELIRMGLHPSEISQGYEMAQNYALKTLENFSVDKVKDIFSVDELYKAIKSSIAAKQFGYEKILGYLVAEAALIVLPKNPLNFNVDNIRVVKILGGSLNESVVIKGMVFSREPEGTVRKVCSAKVGVFSCPLDISQTETKGVVLLKNAKEMLSFTKGEEVQLESMVKELFDSGIKVVVTGGGVGDLVLHYLNKYNLLVIKVLSKFDLQRLCRVVGATPLARLGAPMPEEMGFVDVVETIEIGSDKVTVFRQENESTKTATIVLRGATQNYLDDLERAIDDGVNLVKAVIKDPRLVPGAGATEMELSKQIFVYADDVSGIFQYSIKKYAEAFQVIPRILAENAGLDSTEVLGRLYASHSLENNQNIGVDIEGNNDAIIDAKEACIFDVLSVKLWACKLASEAALTILRVDQIIMSKPAGGPKPPGPNKDWDNE